jgi:hypothetical protein
VDLRRLLAAGRMFAPGARVMAVYANGEAYAATVAEAGAGTYTVDWDDGDQRHRVRQARDVFALVSPAECGGEGDDGGGRRTHRYSVRRWLDALPLGG